jgi:hypothetical protein
MASLLSKIAPNMMAGARAMSTGTVERKVCVVGAAGGIGQSLSMLMKMNPAVTRLALYDVMGTPGVAADVSHMNTKVRAFRCPLLPPHARRSSDQPPFRGYAYPGTARCLAAAAPARTALNCIDGPLYRRSGRRWPSDALSMDHRPLRNGRMGHSRADRRCDLIPHGVPVHPSRAPTVLKRASPTAPCGTARCVRTIEHAGGMIA